MNIVLASKSPRRIEMMRNNGYEPAIIPADIDENEPLNSGAYDTPMFLAFKKALDVEKKIEDGTHPYIIAADTVVFSDRIIGKPYDRDDALNILMSLSGKSHKVVTGVCILKAGTDERECFYCSTDVYFKSYTEDDISDYLNTDEPYDKAGAYAIQGYFERFIEKYEGSYDNVVGFPWDEIRTKLEAVNG